MIIEKRYIELFLHSSPSHTNRAPSPNDLFGDGRYGGAPANAIDNGNGRMGPMGGWDSAIMADDLIRSRV